MPQMAPMMWFYLYFMVIFCLYICTVLVSFNFYKSFYVVKPQAQKTISKLNLW